jgi:hypothetical protein
MTRNEIGVEVGFDHPLDPQPVGGRIGQIDTDVPLRVDDHRSPAGDIAHQVAVQGQTPQLVLPEKHLHSSLVAFTTVPLNSCIPVKL